MPWPDASSKQIHASASPAILFPVSVLTGPGGPGLVVAFGGSVDGHLRGEPEPVQQQRHALEAVADAEMGGDQLARAC